LSLHLLEGMIDQVAGQVTVTWVTPRVLTKPQLAGLQQRLDNWVSKVQGLATQLEDHALGVSA
jgi:26S proteasome regulatory subunit N9